MGIDIDALTFSYPRTKTPVIKALSARFHPGHITAIMGKNGCGKSTLVRLLTGILKPQAGAILIDGHDSDKSSISEIAKLVGCVLQNPSCQIFGLTVEEEIQYGLKNTGLVGDELEERVRYYLDYFELERYRLEYPGHLSKGEKQRLVLSSILSMKPKYLLLDEPTASLDIRRRKMLGEYLVRVKSEGIGVVLMTHDDRFVEHYADIILEMKEGKIV